MAPAVCRAYREYRAAAVAWPAGPAQARPEPAYRSPAEFQVRRAAREAFAGFVSAPSAAPVAGSGPAAGPSGVRAVAAGSARAADPSARPAAPGHRAASGPVAAGQKGARRGGLLAEPMAAAVAGRAARAEESERPWAAPAEGFERPSAEQAGRLAGPAHPSVGQAEGLAPEHRGRAEWPLAAVLSAAGPCPSVAD